MTLPNVNSPFQVYGPIKPHFGHLYERPNFLHFPQRLIWISPQFGHMNFVDSVPGGIGLPQLVQVISENVAAFSVIWFISVTVLLM